MRTVLPPISLDLSASDLAFALASTTTIARRLPLEHQLEAMTGGLPCLSVRTAFDLWLTAMAFPRGSELAMSAVTLPDMVRIAEHHGLVPVPIDIERDTMAPTAAAVEAALSPKTCAIVIAHLFGGRVRLGAIAELAERAGVPLVEDCAQAFAGNPRVMHPGSAVALYSFGPIKSATALGGAIVRVRDRGVRTKMRSLAAAYPLQPRSTFAVRAAKYSLLWLGTKPALYGAAVAIADAAGHDCASIAKKMSRGFAGADLITAIRMRPSLPLLTMLRHRLLGDSAGRISARAAAGDWLSRMLPAHIGIPGIKAATPSWWLFPIAVGNPQEVARALRDAGFDSSPGTTSLAAIPAAAGYPSPTNAQAIMRSIVYVPAGPETSSLELRAVCDVLERVALPVARTRVPAHAFRRIKCA
jgi:dTDP-4-amino-4,6-dideoxygalactose transaminase